MFDNLKKRFSKRRINLQKAERSGTGAADVAAARAALNEYNFLFWLLPHIHYRLTKTNLPVIKTSANEQDDGEEGIEDNDSDDREEREESDEDETEGNESSRGNSGLKKMNEDFFSDDASDVFSVQSHRDDISDAPSIRSTSSGKRKRNSSTTGNQKWQKKAEVTDIVSEELNFMKAVGKLVSKDVSIEEDDIDLFGKLIASELRKMDNNEQCLAKHQINNVIFNIQMNHSLPGWQNYGGNNMGFCSRPPMFPQSAGMTHSTPLPTPQSNYRSYLDTDE